MVEVAVPEGAGAELTLNYAGDLVTYTPVDGIVEVEDDRLDSFLATVSGSRRHVVHAEPADAAAIAPPARSRAKSAQ